MKDNHHPLAKIAEAYRYMHSDVPYVRTDECMVPNIDWVRKSFIDFNNKYFSNTLPLPKFVIPTYKSGTFGECIAKPDYERIKYSDYIIAISNKFNAPISFYEDVLLHEMIHLENFSIFPSQMITPDGCVDIDHHKTECFLHEMSRLNDEHGRDIVVSISSIELDRYEKSMEYNAMMKQFTDNTMYICIHRGGKNIMVYKIDKKNDKLIDEIGHLYFESEIERIKPLNMNLLNEPYSTTINDYVLYREGDDFDGFKKFLMNEVSESGVDGNNTYIPRRMINRGNSTIQIIMIDGEEMAYVS